MTNHLQSSKSATPRHLTLFPTLPRLTAPVTFTLNKLPCCVPTDISISASTPTRSQSEGPPPTQFVHIGHSDNPVSHSLSVTRRTSLPGGGVHLSPAATSGSLPSATMGNTTLPAGNYQLQDHDIFYNPPAPYNPHFKQSQNVQVASNGVGPPNSAQINAARVPTINSGHCGAGSNMDEGHYDGHNVYSTMPTQNNGSYEDSV